MHTHLTTALSSSPLSLSFLFKSSKNKLKLKLFVAVAGSGISQRWVCVIMTFFSLFSAYTIRVLLSIAITEMVKPNANETLHASKYFQDDETCPSELGPDNSSSIVRVATRPAAGTYEWSEYQQVRFLTLLIRGRRRRAYRSRTNNGNCIGSKRGNFFWKTSLKKVWSFIIRKLNFSGIRIINKFYVRYIFLQWFYNVSVKNIFYVPCTSQDTANKSL